MDLDEDHQSARTRLEFVLIGIGLLAAGAVLYFIAGSMSGVDSIFALGLLGMWGLPHAAFTVLSLWPGGRLLCGAFMVGQFTMVPLSAMAYAMMTPPTDPLSGLALYAFIYNWAIAAVFIAAGLISQAAITRDAVQVRDAAPRDPGS